VFTWTHALETVNIKNNVIMVDATESMFKDYGTLLENFYVGFKAGKIQKNHIFRREDNDSTLSIQCALYYNAHYVLQPMVNTGQVLGMERSAVLFAFVLETSKPPGLCQIKQVELYKKFRPFVPRHFLDKTCLKSAEEVLAQVKDETAKKRKMKQATATVTASKSKSNKEATATAVTLVATMTEITAATTATAMTAATTSNKATTKNQKAATAKQPPSNFILE
jgi:hypothetical protein